MMLHNLSSAAVVIGVLRVNPVCKEISCVRVHYLTVMNRLFKNMIRESGSHFPDYRINFINEMQEETIVASPSKIANQQQLCYIISEL